jgi:hypothetical protein
MIDFLALDDRPQNPARLISAKAPATKVRGPSGTVLNELAAFPTALEWARESLRHFASARDPDVHGRSQCAYRFIPS